LFLPDQGKTEYVRILRIVGTGDLISARIFEKHFRQAISSIADLEYQSLADFIRSIGVGRSKPPDLENLVDLRGAFSHLTDRIDFLSPSFEAVSFASFFLYLRDLDQSPLRMLLIAHSPGAWPLDWLLLRPLLREGDIIVAPSQFARSTMLFLCPELDPYIKVIHHPIPSLAPGKQSTAKETRKPTLPGAALKIVTLSRIIETKLIHRQIEAVPHLIASGYKNVHMIIGGPLNTRDGSGPTPYARSLQEKVRRLGLEEKIELSGLLESDRERLELVTDAAVSVNLSLSIEEAFPKASIEPLSLGIPVLSTDWNGFRETVGQAGLLLGLQEVRPGVLDIEPQRIAEGIVHLLRHPVSRETCTRQAERFSAEKSVLDYESALEQAAKQAAGSQVRSDTLQGLRSGVSDTRGLLGKIGFLKPFSWRRMMHYNLDMIGRSLPYLEGQAQQISCAETVFRALLLASVQIPISYFCANLPMDRWLEFSGRALDFPQEENDLRSNIRRAVLAESITTARTALLNGFIGSADGELLQEALCLLKREKLPVLDQPYYEAAAAYQRGDFEIAHSLLQSYCQDRIIGEHEGELLKLWARVCRKGNMPERLAGRLSQWLRDFPDSPASAFVLLEHVYNRLLTDVNEPEVERDLQRLKRLLGPSAVITKLETMLYARS
jgi:glycosyltransferase involved in cell wall biosynthesis